MTNNTMLAISLYSLMNRGLEFRDNLFSYSTEEAGLIHYIYPKYFCYTNPQVYQYHIMDGGVDISRSHIIHKLKNKFGLNVSKQESNQKTKLDTKQEVKLEPSNKAFLLELLTKRKQSSSCDEYWFTIEETGLIVDLKIVPIYTLDYLTDDGIYGYYIESSSHCSNYSSDSYPTYYSINEIIGILKDKLKSKDLKSSKLEDLKSDKPIAGVLQDFSLVLTELVKLMTFGEKKHGKGTWLTVENGIEEYTNAFFRHILKEKIEDVDPETKILHEVATLFNTLARTELRLRKEKTDNE